MIIDYDLKKYIVDSGATLSAVAEKLISSKEKIALCVSGSCKLTGVFTNGDILRIVAQPGFDSSLSVGELVNKEYVYLSEKNISDKEKVNSLLEQYAYVPVVDENHHFKCVLRRRKFSEEVRINDFIISKKTPTFIIAEIGNNHNGDLGLAKKLVVLAKNAGADCVKFQLRGKDLYQDAVSDNLGTEYVLDLLERFQLKDEELFELFDYCKSINILPLCTPWDEASLIKLEEYGMPAYKVSSADLTNHRFLKQIAQTGKPVICSTGMSSSTEIEESISVLQQCGAQYIMLHCNSTYPAPFSDINLNYISRLEKISGSVVGYSGHERGIEVPIAAVALGARVIEKHFTIDQTMEGNDHKVSLLPEDFAKMVSGIRNVESSMGNGSQRVISQGEMMNRVNLAKSLIINCDLSAGEEILDSMIEVKSPGKGIQPNLRNKLVGKIAKRNLVRGDFFYPSDIEGKIIDIKNYNFKQEWGIPVRYHDFKIMVDKCKFLNFVEFHLSYKDLDLKLEDYFATNYSQNFAVHSPELFSGDHIMDLCSDDPEYRKRSIKELQRVVDTTLELKKIFTKTSKPLIVVNVGGFTTEAPLGKNERKKYYDTLAESLSLINQEGVELIPQTMPPFPWHMGGQQFHNLFVDAQEIKDFCEQFNYRICFDVSHSALACNHKGTSLSKFIDTVMPYTAHLHIADALGADGEGLQINEGDIDFNYLFRVMNKNPSCSFIPEIWQGHENSGEGFWIALNRLEQNNK